MTARKNLKRIIRQRMHRTGESYTAARRHFLVSKDFQMTKHRSQVNVDRLQLPVSQLQFTLKTNRILRAKGIERVEQLVDAMSDEANPLGLSPERATEVRDVLASRGL